MIVSSGRSITIVVGGEIYFYKSVRAGFLPSVSAGEASLPVHDQKHRVPRFVSKHKHIYAHERFETGGA